MTAARSTKNASVGSIKAECSPTLILSPFHNSHDFARRQIPVPRSEENAIRIGRAVGRVLPGVQNAVFDCKVLSRNHALIWSEGDTFYIKDTKSSNGTFINNERLSGSGEESEPAALASGDILQLGIEIIDSAKKVASGCIIASVNFTDEAGNQISRNQPLQQQILERIPKHCLVIPEGQMFQLQHYIIEAKHRESALHQKLAMLEEALKISKAASDMNWEAMINEERLLARIEVLEDQLKLCANKNLTPADLKSKIDSHFEQRMKTENMTKDLLRKSQQEASETRQRLQESELALLNVEDTNAFISKQLGDSRKQVGELKYELEKLSGDYDVVCHELELSRATNQHLRAQNRPQNEKQALAKYGIAGDSDGSSDWNSTDQSQNSSGSSENNSSNNYEIAERNGVRNRFNNPNDDSDTETIVDKHYDERLAINSNNYPVSGSMTYLVNGDFKVPDGEVENGNFIDPPQEKGASLPLPFAQNSEYDCGNSTDPKTTTTDTGTHTGSSAYSCSSHSNSSIDTEDDLTGYLFSVLPILSFFLLCIATLQMGYYWSLKWLPISGNSEGKAGNSASETTITE